MKKVNLLCVGKIKENYLREGIEEYSKRISRYARFNIVELKDFPPPDEVKKESDLLLEKLSGFVILTDIDGRLLSSPEIAQVMEKAYQRYPEITFVIGGSEGVDGRIREKADLKLSFGKITFPHQLMRLVLAEQIYRAFTITEGMPYHK